VEYTQQSNQKNIFLLNYCYLVDQLVFNFNSHETLKGVSILTNKARVCMVYSTHQCFTWKQLFVHHAVT